MKINFIFWENDDCQIDSLYFELRKLQVLESFSKTEPLPGGKSVSARNSRCLVRYIVYQTTMK